MIENSLFCNHIYRRGVKKGENCNKKCRDIRESGMCAEHDKIKIHNKIEYFDNEEETKPALFEVKTKLDSTSKPLAQERTLFILTNLLINQKREPNLPLMTLDNRGTVWQIMQGIDYEHASIDGCTTNLYLVRL